MFFASTPQRFGWLLTWATSTCLAASYASLKQLPSISFDFIIVGGGTAGNVVANRLTENPKFNVLIIEDGPDNEGVIDSIIPAFFNNLQGSSWDWNFTTVPQKGADDRVLPYPRGHILGGSSSINGLIYTRGSSSDFNRFAKVTGDPGWSWDAVQPYIKKNERWTSPPDHHNTTGQFNPSVHGFQGVNAVSLPSFVHPVSERILQTSQDLPDEFPFNLDMNSGDPIGVGWVQTTIKDGMRSSSATSYLAPTFRGRPNLHILLNTRVTRILVDKAGSTPSFRTVQFVPSASDTGPFQQLTAKKEVIISAGSVGTPHLLLNSGIGDPAELKVVGINPIVSLSGVGKNLSDQPLVTVGWFSTSMDPLDNLTSNPVLFNEVLTEWNKTRLGPLGTAGPSQLVFARLPDDSPIFQTFADPSSGRNSPHIEMVIFTGEGIVSSQPGRFVGAALFALTPVSRGSIKLASSSPFQQPLIDPAFLQSPFDVFVMRESVKTAHRFFSAPAWDGFVLGPAGSIMNASTDALLDEAIRSTIGTSFHPVGSASMSPKGAKYGVVDPDLLVKGVDGLRIVDASVMPFVTCGHTQAPTYIIAERASDLIKMAWN